MNPQHSFGISLVVASYNRSAELIGLLGTVAEQTLDPALWECVIVDNNSTDDTPERVAEFLRRHPGLPFRTVRETRQGLSHARNAGIRESRMDAVAFVDDDERVVPRFLEAYRELFVRREEALAAGGRVVPEYETGRPRWMSPLTERPVANPTDFGGRVRLFPSGRIPAGGNMAFRRSVFERFGVFDPDLGRCGDRLIGGEESEFFDRLQRAGVKSFYVPDAVIFHRIPERKLEAGYFIRLCRNVGISQRRRAAISGGVGRLRCLELVKWGATLALAAGYALTLRPAKSRWLLRMRWQISLGVWRSE